MKKNQLCERNHVLTTTPYMYGTLPRKSINIKTLAFACTSSQKKEKAPGAIVYGAQWSENFWGTTNNTRHQRVVFFKGRPHSPSFFNPIQSVLN